MRLRVSSKTPASCKAWGSIIAQRYFHFVYTALGVGLRPGHDTGAGTAVAASTWQIWVSMCF